MREAGTVSDLPEHPKSVVRRGWNLASSLYRPAGARSDIFGHSYRDHEDWLRPFFRSVPPGSQVLDLGCGCGVPDARLLSDRFRVTGVDISDVQVERARRLVPDARFLRADMTEVRFPPGSFGGVLCLYSLIHVPVEEHRSLLDRIHRWLRPGGSLLLITGERSYTGVVDDWLGSNATMYWSHADGATYASWLAEAGFEILRRTKIPERGASHALFLARKRPRPPIGRRVPDRFVTSPPPTTPGRRIGSARRRSWSGSSGRHRATSLGSKGSGRSRPGP